MSKGVRVCDRRIRHSDLGNAAHGEPSRPGNRASGPWTNEIRPAGGPRPQRSRKDEGVGDFPGVLARATRCDRGPVAVRYFSAAHSWATAGSWKALPALMPCIRTINLLSNDK